MPGPVEATSSTLEVDHEDSVWYVWTNKVRHKPSRLKVSLKELDHTQCIIG